MKRFLIAIVAVLLVLPLFAAYNENFLSSAITVNAGVTKVNGTDFTSNSIWIARFEERREPIIGIAVTFTRSAGSTSTVDFEFEASWDGGVTWAYFNGSKISVATNFEVVSGNTVNVFFELNSYGVTHIRLKRIKNNDGSNNLTSVNATVSLT